jgi:hypothetical protein
MARQNESYNNNSNLYFLTKTGRKKERRYNVLNLLNDMLQSRALKNIHFYFLWIGLEGMQVC